MDDVSIKYWETEKMEEFVTIGCYSLVASLLKVWAALLCTARQLHR
jgi:hypothetical protein